MSIPWLHFVRDRARPRSRARMHRENNRKIVGDLSDGAQSCCELFRVVDVGRAVQRDDPILAREKAEAIQNWGAPRHFQCTNETVDHYVAHKEYLFRWYSFAQQVVIGRLFGCEKQV